MVQLPWGHPWAPWDAQPLEARYKILLFLSGWEEECISPKKQGQKSICVLQGDFRSGDLCDVMQTKHS